MIETPVRQVDANVAFRVMRALRGKFTRAEPVAALYEKHRFAIVEPAGGWKTRCA